MTDAKEADITLKLLLLGDTSVGKTSILTNYNENKFDKDTIGTIGVEYVYKTITYKNMKIKLQLWDTSGEERFRTITKNFYRNADGLFLVFDLTREDTFNNIINWLSDVKEYNPDLKILLLGNKLDLINERKISTERAANLATKHNLQYLEVSAKDGTNTQKSFEALINLIFKDKLEQEILAEFAHKETSFTIDSNSSIKNKNGNKRKSCC